MIDAEIIMYQDVSHAGDLPPRNRRIALFHGRINAAHCFPDNQQVMHHPDLDQRTAVESRLPLDRLGFDLADGVENILETAVHISHKATASWSTCSLRRGLRPSSVTRSTRQPSKSCRSANKPPRSSNEHPCFGLIRKSTSLVSVLSPRAPEPKTRTCSVRYRSAKPRISDRRSAKVRNVTISGRLL